jgi:hypothetical protein
VNDTRNVYTVFIRKRKRIRSARASGRRWEDNIELNLEETGCDGVDWIYLVIGSIGGIV